MGNHRIDGSKASGRLLEAAKVYGGVPPDPLKTIGEHVVPIRLHRDVTAHVKVKVVPA